MAASALDFVPIGTNAETLPANLTERRFRHLADRQVSWGSSCGCSVDEAFDACASFRRNCNPKCIRDCFRDAHAATCRLAQHCGHPAMAFWATHEAPFVEAYCLLKRDRLPCSLVLSSQIGLPSMLAICDARHSFSSLSGYM